MIANRPLLLAAALVTAMVAGPFVAEAQSQDFKKPERLICVSELSSGFAWKNDGWRQTTFNVDDEKFIVQPSRSGTPHEIEVLKIGKATPEYTCHFFVLDDFISNRATCGGIGMGMLVDFKTLRFTSVYTPGFVDGAENNDNTPNITIGKCTPLN